MKAEYAGRAWVFGDDVTTDDILPGQYLDHKNSEVGQFAFAGLSPEFASNVQAGDIVVAGRNFGAGSGRESAVFAIKHAGVSVVIAASFARLFYRNAINNGLIPVIVESIGSIKPGHRLTVDIEKRVVVDDTLHQSYSITNLIGTSREILEAGGIIPFTKQRLASKFA